MQVSGFLNFPETVEEWEEMLRESEKVGMDYKQSLREDVEEKKEDLLSSSLNHCIHTFMTIQLIQNTQRKN